MPNKMRESILFQTVAPKINSITPERLLFEMCRARDVVDEEEEEGTFNMNARNIDMMCTWMNTPQGEVFWHYLNNEATGYRDLNKDPLELIRD